MNCRDLEEAIVELARGRDVGRGTAGAIEAHVEHCQACAARLTRERQVSRGLQALAASTATQVPSALIERRLLDAFAAQNVQPVRRWWIPAAAAAAAVVGAVGWWQASRVAPSNQGRQAALERRASELPPTTTSTATPATAAIASDGGSDPHPVPHVVAHRSGRRTQSPRAGAGDTGFVALPSAAGLPDFESGVILRMEMPSAALPAYGIEIVPDSKMPIEADLLIGQDGQARAIRLVTRATTRSGAE
jgi:hypothetical protein